MRRASLAGGTLLLALGALAIVEALRLRDDWQGARLMPAVVGAVLVLLGVAHLVRPATGAVAWPDAAGARRIVLVFGALALYVAALPVLGFLPATALFVLAIVRLLGSYSWPRALVLTVLIAVASHVVFKHWLGMPLPVGLLGL
jgi:putative tricarboxylic transport membrane protein